MPLLSSLCSWCLCGELSSFRGPGYYFSLVKLAIVIGLYVAWIGTANWVNRDAPKSQMNLEQWNPALLASGVVGLLLIWDMPLFLLGFLAFLSCLAAGSLSYVYLRNQRVPVEQRVLTEDHLKQLARQLFFKIEEKKIARLGPRPRVGVRLLGREEDAKLVARAEGSKGYQAARQAAQIVSLKQVGMTDHLQELVRGVVQQPHGMIIICGPTDAGKSTSLYACLNEVDRTQQQIITIESPVEYQLANVTQIEVNLKAGATFASELRGVLRQTPSVILISEICDRETAEIVCQAAQAGHMVLTTLSANDTVSAVGRLIDLGVQPSLLSAALSAVLSQRLVRVLCPRCKLRYKPNADLLQRLNLPVDKIKYFYRPPGGKGDEDAERAREACDHCGGTGYQGRTGIFELLVLDDAIRRLIRVSPNLNDIKQEAVKAGMRYLYEDGLRQVIEGQTSIQELLRVCE